MSVSAARRVNRSCPRQYSHCSLPAHNADDADATIGQSRRCQNSTVYLAADDNYNPICIVVEPLYPRSGRPRAGAPKKLGRTWRESGGNGKPQECCLRPNRTCQTYRATPPTFLIWNNLCDLVYRRPTRSYRSQTAVA